MIIIIKYFSAGAFLAPSPSKRFKREKKIMQEEGNFV